MAENNQMNWIDRLRQQQKELSERLGKLKVFVELDAYYDLPCKDKFLLRQQLRFMTGYEIILRQRLERAEKKEVKDA